VWAEQVSLPTYPIGPANKNPMFLEKRVYQGSSGAVYPYPVIDRVFDHKVSHPYQAVYLENDYLKIMVLPEIGGRVHMAQDKTNGYHFIYYNQVIKPALVGLAGPWISGGIEFNWPQHHRPSTFMPVEWQMAHHPDGSVSLVCCEHERMFFTKGMHTFTLHPERAYLQIDVQLYNRTCLPQTFLWWANPAVPVNDDYQSVFPPDVHAVMDHGKRDVSEFPIARGTYYKVNYAPGTDISRYKNIPVPTSYMAHHSDFDFVGNYDHGRQAGMLHVANHHLVPGKKQWTWGNGDFGRAWDRQLTDEDGPYIELMCGAFTDNQPDFSWLMPGEEKRFTQYFLPYKTIGPATNASQDAVIHASFPEGLPNTLALGVYVTAPRLVTTQVTVDGQILWADTRPLNPDGALRHSLALPPGTRPQAVTVTVVDAANGTRLVSYQPLGPERPPLPEPARAAPPPASVATNEELYLHGLHLEQYRHATYTPEPYYEEALRRDPGDARCNNALGLLLLRRGKFAAAEHHFRKAISRQTMRNPNPYDGEAHFNLGLALRFQKRGAEAEGAFWKATWNAAHQASAYFELARLAGDPRERLTLADQALARNGLHHQARHLKIHTLRRLGRDVDALREVHQALEADPMNLGALHERDTLTGGDSFRTLAGSSSHLWLELAHDYFWCAPEEAVHLLTDAPHEDPLVLYTLAYLQRRHGDARHASDLLAQADALRPVYCHPHRLESLLVLEDAILHDPARARASGYLGNFWYAHRQYEDAITCWERARRLEPTWATPLRNLGLAYFNKRQDAAAAWAAYQQAFAADLGDARVLFELDQLARRLNHPPAERLARLEAHRPVVDERDDLSVEFVTLLNVLGRPDDALALLANRRWHPWEGGEGKSTGQYSIALFQLARQALEAGDAAQARAHAQAGLSYPHNLGEGKLPNAYDNNLHYLIGLAELALGERDQARESFNLAARGAGELTSAMYYNDQSPDLVFYQALALHQLERPDEANDWFERMIAYGLQHANDAVGIDYFAVSLPSFLVFDEDVALRHRTHCLYLQALGHLGLGQTSAAAGLFDQVLALDPAHQGALLHRTWEVA
jgi:tetratricopeptide (TPR) repeat protein